MTSENVACSKDGGDFETSELVECFWLHDEKQAQATSKTVLMKVWRFVILTKDRVGSCSISVVALFPELRLSNKGNIERRVLDVHVERQIFDVYVDSVWNYRLHNGLLHA